MDNCARSKCDHFGDAFGSLVIQKLAEMVAVKASTCIWRVCYPWVIIVGVCNKVKGVVEHVWEYEAKREIARQC